MTEGQRAAGPDTAAQQDSLRTLGRAKGELLGGWGQADARAQSNTEERVHGRRVGDMRAGPDSARVKAQPTHGRQKAQSGPAATATMLEAELIGMEKKRRGTRAPRPKIRGEREVSPAARPQEGAVPAASGYRRRGAAPCPGLWGHTPRLEELAALPWQLVGEGRKRADVMVDLEALAHGARYILDMGDSDAVADPLHPPTRAVGQRSDAPREPSGPTGNPGTYVWECLVRTLPEDGVEGLLGSRSPRAAAILRIFVKKASFGGGAPLGFMVAANSALNIPATSRTPGQGRGWGYLKIAPRRWLRSTRSRRSSVSWRSSSVGPWPATRRSMKV